MSVALRGSLRDFGIGEVFQLIGQQHKTGVLEMEDAGQRISVSFENGRVVKAETEGPYEGAALGDMLVRVGLITPDQLVEMENYLGNGLDFEQLVQEHTDLGAWQIEEVVDLLTRDTIFSLLRWTRGSFHFTSQPVASRLERSKLLPAEQILMDGMRMVDEWRALDESVTRGDSVFQRAGRFEDYRQAHPEESPDRLAAAERLFLLIDGRLSVRRVIDLSRLGTFEGSLVLSRLRRRGLIEPVDEEALARRQRRAPVTGTRGGWPARGLLALLPFLLLGAVVATLQLPAPAASRAVFARDPGGEARQAFEARRLRNWVEAYHFARGRWPADLGALAELPGDALFSPGELATGEEPPYYYVRREGNFALLAPR